MFYFDIEANVASPNTEEALKELREKSDMLEIPGCYPAQVGNGSKE